MNFPTLLTLSRIFCVPVLVDLCLSGQTNDTWLPAGVALACFLTDWADGWLARRSQTITRLGTMLDPLADKILVVSLILTFSYDNRIGVIGFTAGLAITAREFLVSGLREMLGSLDLKLPVSRAAKWKTGVQMASLFCLVAGSPGPAGPLSQILGQALLLIAAALSVYSAKNYVVTGLGHVVSGARETKN